MDGNGRTKSIFFFSFGIRVAFTSVTTARFSDTEFLFVKECVCVLINNKKKKSILFLIVVIF